MGEIKNVATLTKDEQANINRAAIEHRATWMGLIYDEFRKAGIDPEPIFRKAIRKCGNIHGENFKAACSDPEDCRDFAKVFLNDLGRKTFEQEVHQVTETGKSWDLMMRHALFFAILPWMGTGALQRQWDWIWN